MHLGPALVHDLLGVQGIRVVGCHLLGRDARVLHRQVVYLMRIHNVLLLHPNTAARPVDGTVHTLVLG